MFPAVNIEKVSKNYGKVKALIEIEFSIDKGSFFGLLGPNGAGKSTLINIMAGLTRATEGHVEVLGNDVRTQWREARKDLGVVPQELAYDPFFTVREMLRLQSGYFGQGSWNFPWIEELLKNLDLSDKAGENIGRLSGGMKRRLLIAQALVHRPSVVVLDEPTAGVDIKLRKVLWKFFKYLNREGHTIILTTHYLEEAEAMCDRLAILDRGVIKTIDDKVSLLAQYPFRMLTLRMKEKESVSRLPEKIRQKIVSSDNGQITFRLHKERDKIGSIMDSLNTANVGFIDLYTEEPGLEEVFMSLMGRKDD